MHRSLGEQGKNCGANVAPARAGTAPAATLAKAATARELLVSVNTCVSWIASVVHRNSFLSV
jgi:hypothetical protein